MTWSYTAVLRQLDEVRLLIGDTVSTDPLLQDEEIAYFLTQEGQSVMRTGARAAEAIAASFSRKADLVEADLQEFMSQKSAQYRQLAKDLRIQARRRGVAPSAGGITRTEKQLQRENTDLVTPFFDRDRDTEPGTERAPNDPSLPEHWPY